MALKLALHRSLQSKKELERLTSDVLLRWSSAGLSSLVEMHSTQQRDCSWLTWVSLRLSACVWGPGLGFRTSDTQRRNDGLPLEVFEDRRVHAWRDHCKCTKLSREIRKYSIPLITGPRWCAAELSKRINESAVVTCIWGRVVCSAFGTPSASETCRLGR